MKEVVETSKPGRGGTGKFEADKSAAGFQEAVDLPEPLSM